jgi:hypothetical protein
MMVLMALSSIAVEQTEATEQTMSCCTQVLDYLLGHSDAKIHFRALNMILNIHSDSSYLSKIQCLQPSVWSFFHGLDANGQITHSFK